MRGRRGGRGEQTYGAIANRRRTSPGQTGATQIRQLLDHHREALRRTAALHHLRLRVQHHGRIQHVINYHADIVHGKEDMDDECFDREKANRLLARVISEEGLPVRLAESPVLAEYVRYLRRSYRLPGRKAMTKRLLPGMRDELEAAMRRTMETIEAYSLTIDGWTSAANRAYVAVTCHGITDAWKLESFLLRIVRVTGSETAARISGLVKEVLKRWGITRERIVSATTDGAANMSCCVRLHLRMPWVYCVSHAINRSVRIALAHELVKPLLRKAKHICNLFKHSPQAAESLAKKQRALKLPVKTMKMDNTTRWGSAYKMMKRMVASRPALSAFLATLRDPPENLDDDEWATLSRLADVLQCLNEASQFLSQQHRPTIGLAMPILNRLVRDHLMPSKADTDARPDNEKENESEDVEEEDASLDDDGADEDEEGASEGGDAEGKSNEEGTNLDNGDANEKELGDEGSDGQGASEEDASEEARDEGVSIDDRDADEEAEDHEDTGDESEEELVYDVTVEAFKATAAADLRNRWEIVDKNISQEVILSIYLDPRSKDFGFISDKKRARFLLNEANRIIRQKLANVQKQFTKNTAGTIAARGGRRGKAAQTKMTRLFGPHKIGGKAPSAGRTALGPYAELANYHKLPGCPIADEDDVLFDLVAWWKLHRIEYPNLARPTIPLHLGHLGAM